ncbi:PDZ domain-containing protein [Alteribacter lacisalsi]|uniref:PDZ domain-containing protein n=1 Tax=Alteribacter lacisalsi TaxID=2045244 RepID=UPI001157EB49|nr:PDZ domain-containing protein [Alteribacter lacisalsi]
MDGLTGELLTGSGRFFAQPLFYLFLLTALWFGFRRVKRERRHFHTRIYDVVHDLFFPLAAGAAAGAGLTIAVLGLGIVIPAAVLLLLSAVWLLFIPFRNSRWLSFTFIGSVTLLITFILPESGSGSAWIDARLMEISQLSLQSAVWFLALIMVAEALLVLVNGPKRTNPLLVKTKRGKTGGAHEQNRLWLAPSFFLLPAGGLAVAGLGSWPFSISEAGALGLLLFPIVLGFKIRSTNSYPDAAVKRAGAGLLLLSAVTAGSAVLAMFYSPAAFAVPILIILGREAVFFFNGRQSEKVQSVFFAREEGLVVLGVIPGLIGEKLGVKVGEKIIKVNGKSVSTQLELYEALQENSAYCRLEVVDEQEQVRFVQSSVYEDDHYQLGLVFVPDPDNGTLSNRALRYSLVLRRDRETIRSSEDDHLHEKEAAASSEAGADESSAEKKTAERKNRGKRANRPLASH